MKFKEYKPNVACLAAEAEKCVGTGSMAEKQRVLKQHTESLKHTMFNKAKNSMLTSFRNLTVCSLLHVKFKNSVTQVNRLFRESLNKMSV